MTGRITEIRRRAAPALDVVSEVVEVVVPLAGRYLRIRRAVGRIEPFLAVTKDLLNLFLGDRTTEHAVLRLHESTIVECAASVRGSECESAHGETGGLAEDDP
jgi:hypothetical protein